ncbi:hypothetical protein GCM10009850_122360 [Nonomuraea monospora]|uniref:Methyltransferase domain-containing protein n=1 Tax=Nonomuraea monospora TaxID=568818 RepID=A0ABN3D5G1_9ACTN
MTEIRELRTDEPVHATAPRTGDAFGETLLAALASGPAPAAVSEVIERDDGLIVASDAHRYFRTPEAWQEPIRWAVAQARGRVLDVGVGAGRHALAAAAAGCEVTGLDVSEGAVEVSRRRGVRAVRGAGEHADRLFGPGSFDTVFLLGQNLALLASPERAGDLLGVLRAVTAPGASILGDSQDPASGSARNEAYFARNRDRGRPPGQFVLRARYLDLATPWFDYWYCSPHELEAVAAPHGWRLEDARRAGTTYSVRLRRV